ncbi:hypothetical protein [Paenarthrobacter sp. PH39-S1]|uniref:hypothetical protein n=1 Tax=Paenarthrobacter sp. PH39-S1 TaxID=3046204 RepID=UPI0024B9BD9F|nr:hypothetical protein [Paenarthrobacter sp. PH39-S1]MDJ0356825.1 hypothetical protein [Paenarthrobacter sp. PH39-S1]
MRLKVVSVAASLLFFAAAFLVKPWLHEWYPVVVLGPWILVCAGTFLSLRALKRLSTLVNLRFAAEFTLRTGCEYPEDVDVLQIKHTVAARSENGSVCLWSVKRKGGSFIIAPVSSTAMTTHHRRGRIGAESNCQSPRRQSDPRLDRPPGGL